METSNIARASAAVCLFSTTLAAALIGGSGCSRTDAAPSPEAVETVSSNQTASKPSALVISQIYGGAGADDALFNRDYVELFNRSSQPVALAGLSIHFGSSLGELNLAARLPSDVIVPPGGYYLVGFAAGQAGTDVRPDAAGNALNILPVNGKLAIVRDAAFDDPAAAVDASAQAMGCGSFDAGRCGGNGRVLDLVGFGVASDHEGAKAAPAAAIEGALFRAGDGCVDTGDNAADFSRKPPMPRTSRSNKHVCNGGGP